MGRTMATNGGQSWLIRSFHFDGRQLQVGLEHIFLFPFLFFFSSFHSYLLLHRHRYIIRYSSETPKQPSSAIQAQHSPHATRSDRHRNLLKAAQLTLTSPSRSIGTPQLTLHTAPPLQSVSFSPPNPYPSHGSMRCDVLQCQPSPCSIFNPIPIFKQINK